ncbi:MAG: hypothetical protein ACXVXP_00350 [Mycobacteriaceae bacterium]
MSSSPGERLRDAVLARRTELDMTQIDLWQAGGPSNTTQTAIATGQLRTLTRTTAKKLDHGLRWEAGSARAVWEGGKPTPVLPGASVRDSAWMREQISAANITDTTRRRLLDVLDDERKSS